MIFDGIKNLFSKKSGGNLPPAEEVAAKILSARAAYEALDFDPLRKRPPYRPQRTETEQTFVGAQRLESYRYGDRAFDNHYSFGSQILTTKRLTIGARGGRPFFTGKNAAELQKRWDSWATSCGHQEDESFSEILGILLTASLVHGDCLILCHKELTAGKVRIYDADQICNHSDFAAWCSQRGLHAAQSYTDFGYRQVDGAVLDPEGRVTGYFVTCLRGMYSAPEDAITFLPRSICRRVGQHIKISQYRGESLALPLEILNRDTDSLIKAEVSAAQNFSQFAFAVVRPPAGGDAMSAAIRGAIDPATGTIREDVAQLLPYGDDPRQLIRQTAEQPADLSQLEGKAAIASIPHGAEIRELKNSDRPSTSILSWLDRASDLSGQRMGLQSVLSRGRNDASYAAGQLELAISWQAIEELREMLEQQVISYCVQVICPEAEGYRVQWPSKIEIDPEKTQRLEAERLRTGVATYQDLIGPGWRDKLLQIKELTDYCHEIGLPLNVLSWLTETGAGNAKAIENEGDETNEN